MEPVAVIGAGSWGTALALLVADKGFPVRLWVHSDESLIDMKANGENRAYLPGFPFPTNITVTRDLEAALHRAHLVISVTPSHAVREVMGRAGKYLSDSAIIVSASKGIENDSLKTMDGVLHEVLPAKFHDRLAFLSGPSFAKEVAQRLATVVVVASHDEKIATQVQTALYHSYFRTYRNTDVVGTEIGGALKNVIAIATGGIDGFGLGLNARAAVITRGLAEITRLGQALGANPLTFLGLAGMGDLILTCTGELSHNRRVGFEIGRGRTLTEILHDMKMVAEGVKTTEAALELGARRHLELPIATQMAALFAGRTTPAEAVASLMLRPQRIEVETG